MTNPVFACTQHETLEKLRDLLSKVEDPLSDDWDPIEVSLLLAKLEYEDLDLEAQRRLFAEMAETVKKSVPERASLKEQAENVIKVFAETLGFQGDKTNYYNIKNSFVNDVFMRRRGIPISLSMVFMGLCRAVGLRAVGIGFPGHFLVRMVPFSAARFPSLVSASREQADDWTSHWFIDCFDGGKVLTVADCEQRLKEWTRGVVTFGPEVLKVAHPREIVSRTLRNLRAIFAEKEDLARLSWVLTALIELCPDERTESLKERGVLMYRIGRIGDAVRDLGEYVRVCGSPEKVAPIENLLRLIENQAELVN